MPGNGEGIAWESLCLGYVLAGRGALPDNSLYRAARRK